MTQNPWERPVESESTGAVETPQDQSQPWSSPQPDPVVPTGEFDQPRASDPSSQLPDIVDAEILDDPAPAAEEAAPAAEESDGEQVVESEATAEGMPESPARRAFDLGQDEPPAPVGTDFDTAASDRTPPTVASTGSSLDLPGDLPTAAPGAFDLGATPPGLGGAFDQSPTVQPYGQQTPYGHPGGYGQPNPYRQPGSYGEPGPYGQPAQPGQSSGYGQPSGFGAPASYGGYGQPSSYGTGSAPSAPSAPYGYGQQSYGPPGAAPSAPSGPYGAPGQAGPAGQGYGTSGSAPSASSAAPYGQPQSVFGQPSEYGQTQQPYADPQGQPYGQQPPYGQQAPYAQPGYGQPGQPGFGQPGYGQQSPYGYGQQPGYGMQPYSSLSPAEEKTWATAAHWSGPAAALVSAGVLGWLGPLIVMTSRGSKSPRVRAAAIEALNFQITIAIGFVISYILTGIAIGAFLWPLVGLASLIFSIMGAVAENQGRPYKYPFSIKIIK
ncbi:MAG: DUF4870 domain-containing protein [Micropruina sp.]|uniref:DUF4870 domain-containing protein n=1 Tax=Micropruina sp. TaxID=2737536 RepID=UPI0039E72795